MYGCMHVCMYVCMYVCTPGIHPPPQNDTNYTSLPFAYIVRRIRRKKNNEITFLISWGTSHTLTGHAIQKKKLHDEEKTNPMQYSGAVEVNKLGVTHFCKIHGSNYLLWQGYKYVTGKLRYINRHTHPYYISRCVRKKGENGCLMEEQGKTRQN